MKKAGILLEPHVTVLILEYESQGVTVTGEVRTPGVYPLLGNRTVLDMIAMAGGLNENAGKVASVFHRGNPNDIRQVKLNVSVQTPSSIAASRFDLLPGDTISVSRSGVIYVIGDVGRPGGFLVEHNDRLTRAAGARVGSGSQSDRVFGWHPTDAQDRERAAHSVMEFDLKKI